MTKLKKYLQTLSPAAKASFWFVVSNVMLKGISFLTTPIFTRMLDVADYGTTSVFVTWENVISIFATLSLAGGVYNVAMTKYEDDVDGFTSSMITLTAICTSIVYGVCILFNLFCPQVFELSNSFLLFMWVQTFTNACATFWLMRKRFNYLYKSVIAYTFFNALVSPVVAIIAIMLFPSNQAYAKVVGAGIPAIVVGVLICINIMWKGKKFYDKTYWIYALKFNVPLLPHYLSSVLLSAADKLMINSLIGKAETGIYSIAHSITGIVSLVTQAINMALIPYTLQSIKQKQYRGLKRTITGCTVLVAFVCVGITLFAREGILIFSTEQYLPAIAFVVPLAFAVLIEFLSGIVGNIVFYYEKTGFMSAATVVAASVNVVLNYVGIQLFGYIAAGYTTLISAVVKFVLYYYGVSKYEKNMKEIINIKMIVLIFGVYSCFMIYSLTFAYQFIARIILVIILGVLLVLFRKKIVALFKTMKA